MTQKALASSFCCTIPKAFYIAKRYIVIGTGFLKIDDQKRNAILPLKVLHILHLMLMDILQGKTLSSAFFGIKTNWHPLHIPDIIYGTFLFKIC